MQIVSLTFDDGLRCQIDRAIPILEQYGLVASFFIVANTEPVHPSSPGHRKIEWNSDDIHVLKSMADRGHEIGSHSVTHTRPSETQNYNSNFEATESKRLISEWIEREVTSFCYPYCIKDGGLKDAVVAANYNQARAGAKKTYYPIGDRLDYFDVDCRQVGENDRRENVADWKRFGSHWHVLMYHGIGDDNEGWCAITPEEFQREMAELAAYRDANEVEVLTFANAAQYMRDSEQSHVSKS